MTGTVLSKRPKIQDFSVTQTKIYSSFFFVTFLAAFFAAFLAGALGLPVDFDFAAAAGTYFHEAGFFTPLLVHLAPASTHVFNHDS